jgi:hypothetical protein
MNRKLMAAAGVVVLALGAWAVFSALESETGPPGPLAIYSGPWNQDDGSIRGVLVLDGPCVYLDTGRARVLVAFAASGTWWVEGDPPGIRLPAGTFRIGDYVEWAAGSGGDWEAANWEVPPDPGCDLSAWTKVSHGGR